MNFEDEAYVKPECVGRVSSISMGFTDTSEESSTPDSMSTAISGELLCQPPTLNVSECDDLSDCEWIALANCDHDPQCFVTDSPFDDPPFFISLIVPGGAGGLVWCAGRGRQCAPGLAAPKCRLRASACPRPASDVGPH